MMTAKQISNKRDILNEINNIAYYLILNSHLCTDIGLYYGKTGMSIFFLHLYKHTSDKTFSNMGFDLIADIQSRLHLNFFICYAKGLSGIGAGIEYMCKKKLIKGDSNEILEDFDKIILDAYSNVACYDCSISKGLCGLGKYLLYREASTKGCSINANKKIKDALKFILHIIDTKIKNDLLKYEQDYLNPAWRDILSFLIEMSKYEFSAKYHELIGILMKHNIKKRVKISYPQFDLEGRVYLQFGLYDGYSGRGLSLLQKINTEVYGWHQLL